MPFQKGRAKTGGRKKGSPARQRILRHTPDQLAAAVAKVRAGEVTPLDAMGLCLHMSIEEGDRAGILAAASAMAPYVHQRLSASEVTVRKELPSLSDAELLAEADAIEARRAATSRLIEGAAEPDPAQHADLCPPGQPDA